MHRLDRSLGLKSSVRSGDSGGKGIESVLAVWVAVLLRLTPMSKVTMRIRKYIVNRLLDRQQFVIDLTHPGDKAPSRDAIKDLVSKQLKSNKDHIVVFGLETKFGGGHTTGFGLVYNNIDALKNIEPKHRLIKAGLAEKSKLTRRMRKNSRKQKMKVWGSGVRAQRHRIRRQQRKEELGA
jgi:small subunit ribosomal protein S24e